MSAPLYSRFKRYADREAKRFPKKTKIRHWIPRWKSPHARAYSLTDNAALEVGRYSSMPPSELLRGMQSHELPAPYLWVEVPFDALMAGSFGSSLEEYRGNVKNPITLQADGTTLDLPENEMPVRAGFMFSQTGRFEGEPGAVFDYRKDEEGQGLIFFIISYLTRSGSFYIGPIIGAWMPDGNPLPVAYTKDEYIFEWAGLGKTYLSRDDQPRLMKKLHAATSQFVLGGAHVDKVYGSSRATLERLNAETQGSTRLAIALLTACMTAKAPHYTPGPDATPAEVREAKRRAREVVEIDLFLRQRERPGHSIRASVGALEAQKKREHTVGAHWAYRARKDGGDPTECPNTQFGYHDFEPVDGTKSEVCIMCGQKRWRKDAHKRGDPSLGQVAPKIYNVRV